MPIRVEHEVAHRVAEHRRAVKRAAHNDSHGQHQRVPIHYLELERRDVHDDVTTSQILRQPAPALEVQLQLLHPTFHRHVELGASRDGYHTIFRQAMAPLKFRERLFKSRIKEVLGLVRYRADEPILEAQPLAQRRHGSAAVARVQRESLGDRGPAARCRDAPIACQRLAQSPVANFRRVQTLQRGGDVPRRQCGLQHDGDVGGAPVRYPFRAKSFGIHPTG